MQRFVSLIFTAASCTAALLLAAAPVAAQGEQRRMVVRHADLDLADAAGRAMLNRRVTAAAKTVCGVENSRELARSLHERRCVATARGQAMATAVQFAAKRAAGGASLAARR